MEEFKTKTGGYCATCLNASKQCTCIYFLTGKLETMEEEQKCTCKKPLVPFVFNSQYCYECDGLVKITILHHERDFCDRQSIINQRHLRKGM